MTERPERRRGSDSDRYDDRSSAAPPVRRRIPRVVGWVGRGGVACAVVYVLTFTPRSLQTLRAGARGRPDTTTASFMTAADSAATPDFGGAPASRAGASLGDGGVATVDWPTLATLDLQTGVPGARLQRVAGRHVRVAGYIVPLDDGLDEVEDFLLVPYVGACIHVPPPPANQMILVHMRGRPVAMEWWVPEWVEGTLTVAHVDSPYGAAGFTLAGTAVTHYQGGDGAP